MISLLAQKYTFKEVGHDSLVKQPPCTTSPSPDGMFFSS
jgi:hypothetical protein